MLLLVEGEDLSGIGAPLTFFSDIGEEHKASCFHSHLCQRRSFLLQMGTHPITDLGNLPGLILFGTSPGVRTDGFYFVGQIVVTA